MRAAIHIRRVHTDTPDWCWMLTAGTRKRTLAIHLSLGRPIWWRPDMGRKSYSGITELRAGWLLMAVQIAWKRR